MALASWAAVQAVMLHTERKTKGPVREPGHGSGGSQKAVHRVRETDGCLPLLVPVPQMARRPSSLTMTWNLGNDPWVGLEVRECGEHRTTGGRAWCFEDSEWCYPSQFCRGCELAVLRARIAYLEGEESK